VCRQNKTASRKNPGAPVLRSIRKVLARSIQKNTVMPLTWLFVRPLYLLQRQVVKNAFSWGLHFSAYAFAQEKLLTMVKITFSWASNNEI